MAAIHEIRDKIAKGQFEFSRHAVDQSILRRINVQQIREAHRRRQGYRGLPGRQVWIELSDTRVHRGEKPVHVHCSHPSRSLIKIITVYEPNPNLWIDFEVRKA